MDNVTWLRHMGRPWNGAPNPYTESAAEIERLRAWIEGLRERVSIHNADTDDCSFCREIDEILSTSESATGENDD